MFVGASYDRSSIEIISNEIHQQQTTTIRNVIVRHEHNLCSRSFVCSKFFPLNLLTSSQNSTKFSFRYISSLYCVVVIVEMGRRKEEAGRRTTNSKRSLATKIKSSISSPFNLEVLVINFNKQKSLANSDHHRAVDLIDFFNEHV